MRIALACPYAWDSPGGVQVHVRQLAASLRARGHQTLVLAPAWHTDLAEEGVAVVGHPIRVPFNGSVAPICPNPLSRRRIHRALADFRPDVVHAHEPFSPSTGFFATIEATVPVVAISHTYFERSVVFPAFARAFRPVWRRPALWLAVSEATAGFLRRYLGPSAAIRVVPNGLDIEPFVHAQPAEGLLPGRRILFVSRLEPRKGFAMAVRAFGHLAEDRPDVVMVVAGDGPERRALEDLPRPLRERVQMLGTVPHADVPRYQAAADVFIGPATGRESFGYILVEAMAAGVPVVATDIPGYREVVRTGRDGLLVPPNDPAALAGAVGRVLDDPALAARLSEAGRARAQRFRWEVVAAEVEAAYCDAIGASRA